MKQTKILGKKFFWGGPPLANLDGNRVISNLEFKFEISRILICKLKKFELIFHKRENLKEI